MFYGPFRVLLIAIIAAQMLVAGCSKTNTLAFISKPQFDIVQFGAVCDDITDDYMAIQNALDSAGRAGGGVVSLPSRTCKTTKTLHFNYSHLTLSGNGTIDFVPIPPILRYESDRAIQVNDSHLYAVNSPIAGPITVGDVSFTAQSVADVANLQADDWIVVNEIDQGADTNIVSIEWKKVASVSGPNVTVQSPFRVAFPNGRPFNAPANGGLGFFKIERLIEDSTISNIHVHVPLTLEPVSGIAVGVAKNTTIRNVTVDVASGNAFFAYRSNELSILDSHQTHDRTLASEMAAVTDLVLARNIFDNGPEPPDTSSLTLDFGTGFFLVQANRLLDCGNLCMQVVGGVHDGRILQNEIGFVSDAGNINTAGILAAGVNSVKITGNVFAGGAGAASTAIAVEDTTNYTLNINSCGNQIGPNLISGFALSYSRPSAKDNCNVYIF